MMTGEIFHQEIESSIKNNQNYIELLSKMFPGIKIRQFAAASFDDLYDHYLEVGFIHKKKMERIEPYLDLIRQNWNAALKEREVFWTTMYEDSVSKKIGSLSTWRSTNKGWLSQHLTSQGFPVGVCAMLLTNQAVGIKNNFNSAQCLYSPENRFAQKIYGKVVNTIGKNFANALNFDFLNVIPSSFPNISKGCLVRQFQSNDSKELYELVKMQRGKIYADAEGLNQADIELIELNRIFQSKGLSRKRFVWLAYLPNYKKPVGAVLAYRGPLGLNFSFFENKCDLLIDYLLKPEERKAVIIELLKSASQAYFDTRLHPGMEYPLNYIPLFATETDAKILYTLGAQLYRKYTQTIWLKEGFIAWGQHIERVFSMALLRLRKQRNK